MPAENALKQIFFPFVRATENPHKSEQDFCSSTAPSRDTEVLTGIVKPLGPDVILKHGVLMNLSREDVQWDLLGGQSFNGDLEIRQIG